MSWVSCITEINGSLGVYIKNMHKCQIYPLAELADYPVRGISTKPTTTLTVRFNLGSLVRATDGSFAEVLEQPPSSDMEKHAIFEGSTGRGKVYRIPALVILSWLVAPHFYLLPLFFQPNLLHAIAEPAERDDKVFWKLLLQKRTRSYSKRFINIFSMICTKPSLQSMVASIHGEALRGRIDFRLPDAIADVTLHGYKIDGVFFCTYMTGSMSSNERAIEWLSMPDSSSREKLLFRRDEEMLDCSFPLTDEEWSVISDILSVKAASMTADVRGIVNSILMKHHTGRGWKSFELFPLKWYDILGRFRDWKLSGRWSRVCEELRKSRPLKGT